MRLWENFGFSVSLSLNHKNRMSYIEELKWKLKEIMYESIYKEL